MIFRRKSRTVAVAFAMATGVAFITPAGAQDAAPQPAPAAPAQSPSQSYDDQKLEAFTVAFLAVSDIQQEYSSKFRQAPDDGKKQQIQTEATQKMEKAVNDTNGISVDEYNQIIQSAQTDEALAQKLNGMIGQASQQKQ